MRRFCDSVSEDRQREALLAAVHGGGAFRRFRSEVERLRLTEAWFAFRLESLERVVLEWAEDNGLECVDDRNRSGPA
ncbi:MAG: hypothetical protein KC776_43525 [Myxococcales bacterium]|nr:hypothetical protein [Myxococcales bacterium]MCB9582223.1 hypothetical protein [Polyangiaceae bacterium]